MANNELMHYGVLGMRWGVRRSEAQLAGARGEKSKRQIRREERADRAIRRINTQRENNKRVYEDMKKESREIYSGKKANKLAKSLASDKALYDSTEVDNKYALAVQNAKKDPGYKKTSEYQKAVSDYNKQTTQRMIYGEFGHQRIETLKNLGYSNKRAVGRTLVEETLAGVGTAAVIAGVSYLQSR